MPNVKSGILNLLKNLENKTQIEHRKRECNSQSDATSRKNNSQDYFCSAKSTAPNR